MSSQQPCVLEISNLLEFFRQVLDHTQAGSILVICSTRAVFENWLRDELHKHELRSEAHENLDELPNLVTQDNLRTLAASSTLQTVFCPEPTHLRAYLASLLCNAGQSHGQQGVDNPPFLFVLNLVQAHRGTMSYSAQGFNRTLALMIEAAHNTGRRAVLCECQALRAEFNITSSPPSPNIKDTETDKPAHDHQQKSPWDEEIGIVDMHTKTFGPGSKGWTGRTVSIRQVGQRWFVFCQRLKT